MYPLTKVQQRRAALEKSSYFSCDLFLVFNDNQSSVFAPADNVMIIRVLKLH